MCLLVMLACMYCVIGFGLLVCVGRPSWRCSRSSRMCQIIACAIILFMCYLYCFVRDVLLGDVPDLLEALRRAAEEVEAVGLKADACHYNVI